MLWVKNWTGSLGGSYKLNKRTTSVADPRRFQGGPGPLYIFRSNWGSKGRKSVFWNWPPHPHPLLIWRSRSSTGLYYIVVLRNWIKKTSKYYYVLFSCLKVCLLNSLRTCKREKKKVKRLERSIERNNWTTTTIIFIYFSRQQYIMVSHALWPFSFLWSRQVQTLETCRRFVKPTLSARLKRPNKVSFQSSLA